MIAELWEETRAREVPASWLLTKRVLDVSLGTLILIVTFPFIFAAALAIVLVDRGSPFYAQERVGLNGRRFRMYKLRTMVKGAHDMRRHLLHLNEADGPVFKIKNDPRLHPLGAFLRRTSIDELPNLFNVLRGEMSLVGPRPPLPSEVIHYTPYALRRLTVLPGITCLWQINGRCSVSFDEWMELDNRYIDTWTPWTDLAILLRTIPAVIRKDGAH
ncbi:MAG TPA: sugar transferase [Candidatus Baltobacteraceae bacterium]|nr:sugar transferase [Candidatus Baltobacteraceae bacterium]